MVQTNPPAFLCYALEMKLLVKITGNALNRQEYMMDTTTVQTIQTKTTATILLATATNTNSPALTNPSA